MTIVRCDVCKNEMPTKPIIVAVNTVFPSVEICRECARPVIDSLNKNQLLQDRLAELGFQKTDEKVS